MSYSVRSFPRTSKPVVTSSRASKNGRGYPPMLKHSVGHYGSSGAPPTTTIHPLTSSSHSGDTSHHLHHSTVVDPTRFIEGPPPQYMSYQTQQRSHSKSYLDQSFPSIHNSRLFLDSSRISRTATKDDLGGSHQKTTNGSIYYSPGQPPPLPPPPHNAFNETSNTSNITSSSHQHAAYFRHGILQLLSLLSVLSLLVALNSLYFLLDLVNSSPHKYENGSGEVSVAIALSAMSLSINLCVVLVSSAQYFFAVSGTPGSTKFLQKVTVTRGIAIGGFFISIPIFLSAIVLYTFTHLSFSPPALIATACVGTAIIFGGCSMVHQVFTWQQEKTAKRILIPAQFSPHPTLELSTLV